MSRIEQLNSASRFLICFLILLILFDAEKQFMIYVLLALLLIIIFYYIYTIDENGIIKDLVSKNKNEIEEYTRYNLKNSENNTINNPLMTIYNNTKDSVLKGTAKTNNIDVQSGYISSDGNYKIGSDYSDIENIKDNNKDKIPYDKYDYYVNNTSRKPTKENPYANIVFTDYLDATNIAGPVNIDDKDIQKDMQNMYNSTIYRNFNDVYERENSQRIFFTQPITSVPNSQTDFANWLYKTGPTCKENTEFCTYYESPNEVSQRY